MKRVTLKFDIKQKIYAVTNEDNGMYMIATEIVRSYSCDTDIFVLCVSGNEVLQRDCFDNPEDATKRLLEIIKEDKILKELIS